VADRDRAAGLPQIPLTHLTRAIDRPLMRPLPFEQRPHLTQIVIQDRLAAVEPERLDQLADADPRQLRILLQQPTDLVPKRLQLRRPLRNTKRRRLG
jgi:hypothetical protein